MSEKGHCVRILQNQTVWAQDITLHKAHKSMNIKRQSTWQHKQHTYIKTSRGVLQHWMGGDIYLNNYELASW